MNKAISRALWGAFFVGGLTVLGAGAAHAADTSGEDGTASGNQVGLLGDLPVTIGGNAISILGDSESSGTSTESSTSSTASDANTTNGADAIAGGNQVMPDADLPIVIGGNSISVIGDSSTEGTQASAPSDSGAESTETNTTGEDGTASGNQVMPDVDAPITVVGNDISVIRDDALGDGLLNDGLLDDGLLDDGLLDNVIVDLTGPVLGVMPAPGITEVISDPVITEPVITAPVVDGPLIGDVDLSMLAPVASDSTDGADGTDGTPGADGIDGVVTPLMATAAITPAMMLAATGAEALPLIGGIALLLGSGLGMVGLKRVTGANG